MCCLKYENDEYEAAKEALPDLGQMIETPLWFRKSSWIKYFRTSSSSRIPEQERVLEYTLDEIIKEGAVSVQSTD